MGKFLQSFVDSMELLNQLNRSKVQYEVVKVIEGIDERGSYSH
jgi:hypothetical protein